MRAESPSMRISPKRIIFLALGVWILYAAAVVALAQESSATFYAIERIAGRIHQPTRIVHRGDELLYITERRGQIRILEEGELRRIPFLDLRDLVDSEASFEQGLLSLAFDPDYDENGFFYVTYSDADLSIHLARFRVSEYRTVALPRSGEVLLSVEQASPLHKGGHIQFGADGYLYMTVGDGGLSEEPDSTGQNRDDLRGKLLRIDVSGASPYAIPPDNPFRDIEGYAPEIWLLGLRNPWHFSFAPGSQALYITDVGWSSAEEINYLPAAVGGGWNYGWRIFEGDILVEAGDAPAQAADSASEEFVFPIYAYPHLKPLNYDGSFPIGCAIIGGIVYRGEALPELRGAYIFSDYCHGDLWALSKTDDGWQSRELFETDLHITALGEDHGGEIHFTNLGGDLYTLIHAPDHDYDYDSLSNEDDNCPLVANLDQADNWGHVGVGDACDEDFYFNKVDGTEVKMFQQHYGAWHIYACNNSGCGLGRQSRSAKPVRERSAATTE